MTEMMSNGVELMFAGMGIVFLFLTMLVGAINLMSSLVQRFFPDMAVMGIMPAVSSGIDKQLLRQFQRQYINIDTSNKHKQR